MEEYEEYVRQGLNGEAPLKLISPIPAIAARKPRTNPAPGFSSNRINSQKRNAVKKGAVATITLTLEAMV